MRNVWTIARREFNLYIISPIAYVVAFFIMLILGIIFYINVLAAVMSTQAGQSYVPTIQIIVEPLVSLFLFTSPAITMRTIADEQRTGTLETLLTAPVRDWELIIGKWLGALLFYLVIISLTLIFPIVLNIFINPGIDKGLLLASYIGMVFLVATFISIGVLASSLVNNQIAAFFIALGTILVLWMISTPSQLLPSNGSQILVYLDLRQHFFNTFLRGIIELKDIVYYLSITVLALFLSTMSVESRRWR